MSNIPGRLTFREGGWVLALLGLVIFGIIAWAVAPAVLRLGNHAPGNGETISSYRFDMSNLLLEDETLVPVMQHRDMSPVLFTPPIYSKEEVAEANAIQRNKYIVSGDLVIGIEINGNSRAYPLHVLNVHEIVNDILGGVPIVLYWNWPSGHIAVFERTFNGKVIPFGISGLSGNGSMLMYEKREGDIGGEQLFSAILGHSVTGDPVQLTPVVHEVTSWKSWIARHPETESLAPDENYKKRYRKGNPRTYFLNDTIYFPVRPMPEDTLNPKTPVIAVQTNYGYAVYKIQSLLDAASDDGTLQVDIDDKIVTFTVGSAPLFAVAKDEYGNTIPTQRALWFTWYANHPDAVISNH